MQSLKWNKRAGKATLVVRKLDGLGAIWVSKPAGITGYWYIAWRDWKFKPLDNLPGCAIKSRIKAIAAQ